MRKQRTRQHIIADLGVNHVEKQVLLAGFTLTRESFDYGMDGYIRTFDENGELESNFIEVQVKSSEFPKMDAANRGLAFDLSVRDLENWLTGRMPMALVLYFAQADKAYFVELTQYFRQQPEALRGVRKFVRVFIPLENVFDPSAAQYLRMLKIQL